MQSNLPSLDLHGEYQGSAKILLDEYKNGVLGRITIEWVS